MNRNSAEYRAVEYGKSVGETTFKDFIENPSYFFMNIEGAKNFCKRMAEVGLYTCWVFFGKVYSPSDKWKKLASDTAIARFEELEKEEREK